jgi:ADP-ribose pyrophosphatase YjhB (NUDIX family)
MRDSKPFTMEEFEGLYTKVPRLAVDLVIRQGKTVILTKRAIDPYKGMWHVPGGTLLLNEPIAEAIERIAHNEVGMAVEVRQLLGIVEFPHMEKVGGIGHAVSLAYLCVAGAQTGPVQGDTAERGTFFQLPGDLIPQHAAFLARHWGAILR